MSKIKILVLVVCVLSCIFVLNGCQTVPTKDSLPMYSFNGVQYVPLVSLCNINDIAFKYDTFSRIAILSKNSHTVNVHVGDQTVLVDGVVQSLRNPVEIHKGTVVVPYSFRTTVIDRVFKPQVQEEKLDLSLGRIKKIIVDSGHGGKDPGAIGRTGLREKDVTLDISKRLVSLLRANGFEVTMTRSSDRFIPLQGRVDLVNASGADLFICIHANASRTRSLNGFEVYYVSNTVSDSQRAIMSAKTSVPNLGELSVPGASANLKATLWDMIYTYSRAESIELGGYICKSVRNDLNNRILGIKDARFCVLRGARMPAVLVEVGFLSNPAEEKLKNGFFRQKIAESIGNGLLSYTRDLASVEGVCSVPNQ